MATPQPGEIWFSPLIGHKVKITSVERNRRVIITDGTRNYSMPIQDFEDAGNAWACIRKSALPTPLGSDPRPRPPARLRPKYEKRRKTKHERANGS